MADIELTVKSTLETATGLKAYVLQKPSDSINSCVVFQVISERKYIHMTGKADVKTARVQITSIAPSYSALKTIVTNVENAFVGTTSGWLVSIPLETNIYSKEDGLYFNVSEYYIHYK